MNDLQKMTKPRKFILIIGIIIVTFGLFGGGILSYFISQEQPTNLSEVTEERVFSKIDVELVTSYFATLTTDSSLEKYYFVMEDGYTYIAKIDDDTFASLKENHDYNYSTDPDAVAPESVTIVGESELIPDEIKNFAIEYFRDSEGLDITEENFNNLIYPYLIDTYVTKTDTIIDIAIVFGVITVVGLILIMVYMNRQTKTKKSISKYQSSLKTIEEELESSTTIHNEICKVYLTENYLISYNDGLKIIELKSISWLYPYEYRRNGVVTNRSICIYTSDKQKYMIGNINAWGKNKDSAYNEMYQLLLEKTPDALHGYSKENKEKALKMEKFR
ncbi:MAG TPA: hypothetical protein IAB40_06810 [Candidatus Onthocola stercoravium]|nr:hypothetical protein [Candidatus Onthocola stercoravium]